MARASERSIAMSKTAFKSAPEKSFVFLRDRRGVERVHRLVPAPSLR